MARRVRVRRKRQTEREKYLAYLRLFNHHHTPGKTPRDVDRWLREDQGAYLNQDPPAFTANGMLA